VEDSCNRLMRKLNYQFKNPRLLVRALTHRSMGDDNYERLEFLGDSILSFVMSAALFEQFATFSEGELSRLRAFLVKGETLAVIAKEIDLGEYLRLGQGELKSGGFRRESTLADSLEAIFAAIYLDSGIEAVREVILSLYESRLADNDLKNNLKDPKTQLQEYLQSKKLPLPIYTLIEITGDSHQQSFKIGCRVDGIEVRAEGKGGSRRKAEQAAAKKFMKKLAL